MRTSIIRTIGNVVFFLFCAVILFFSLRGLPGNPTAKELNTQAWKDNGPFELSPERGRFALLYSLVEDNSFSFSTDLARFTVPDLGYFHGKYVSLFAPALSFLLIPGYVFGKAIGISQVGAQAIIALFALLNLLLIRAIAIRWGASPLAATIAGFTFLFATPAFTYAGTLYQHHVSTFLILLALYLLIRFTTIWSLLVIWMLCAFSLSVDYPNFFLMVPIGIAALARSIWIQRHEGSIDIKVSFIRLLTIMSVIIPMIFFFWTNTVSYGNPLQLAGAVRQVTGIKANGSPVFKNDSPVKDAKQIATDNDPQQNIIAFFKNRNLITGMYILLLSPDRGVLFYTPSMFFAIVGIILAFRHKKPFLSLLLGVLGINILLYAMWGDPWGGWAFGARYLIPAYAILSLFIAIALTNFRKSVPFLGFFFLILVISLGINTMGVITTSENPPQVQIQEVEKLSHKKAYYTIENNVMFLSQGKAKAFVFDAVAHNYLSAWNYYILLTTIIMSFAAVLIVYLSRERGRYEV